MTYSTTISNSLSKAEILEAFSVSSAALELRKTESFSSITNEQIRKGDPILDTYEVLSDAVLGGMGSVWRVHHNGWNVDLAMKRPQPRFFAEGSEDRKDEFIRECENWINLGLHPNIVSCYYVREIGGVPTIFSEWMDKGSLKDCIRDGSLYSGSPEEVQERILDIAIQAARGLAYSHENGLVHQDVKPGNLLLTNGWEAKVADFGLAKARKQLEENSGRTDAFLQEDPVRSTGYTLAYCPAEQIREALAKEWMDVYAWALTVLEMYAGGLLWTAGGDVKEQWDNYAEKCRFPIPQAVEKILSVCVKSRVDHFEDILPDLLDAYAQMSGMDYPRRESKSAPDTAGSLNNRALSFLDLGKREDAETLWEEALRKDPLNGEARFNRELSFVRSGKKMDYQGIAELRKYPETQGEYADSMIREFGGEAALRPFLDRERERHCFDGYPLSAVLQGDTIWLALRNEFDPLLVQFPIDGREALTVDRLQAVRERKLIVWHMAIHPAADAAAFWMGEHTVCLYDMTEKRIIAEQELPEELEPEHDLSPDTENVFFRFSPDGRFLVLGNVTAYRKRSLILDARTLDVVRDLPCGLPGGFSRCLILGETGGMEAENCIPHDPISDQIHGAIAFDPANHILYEDRYTPFGRRLFVTEQPSGKVLFTGEGGCLNDDWADWKYLLTDDGRSLVAWRGAASSAYWIRTELPAIPTSADMASWQLSRLRSFGESMQEEERMQALQKQFTLLMQQKEYARAITVHESLQEMQDYPMSEMARQNEDALHKVAKVKGIRAIRCLGELEKLPDEIEARINAEDAPKHLFPDYITRVCRRGDKYYAFNLMLDCEIYDESGKLLSKPIHRKPPKKKPDSYHCPSFHDLDPSGRYLLYSLWASEDPYGKKQQFGTYLRDLEAARKFSLFPAKDSLTELQPKRTLFFLTDGTIIESWDLGYRRYAADGTSLLREVSVNCEDSGESEEHVSKESILETAAEGRWIICCNTAYYILDHDHGYYYSILDAGSDTVLYHWFEKENNMFELLPGNRFFCTWSNKNLRIRDLQTGDVTQADKGMSGGGFYALPGSRYLYQADEFMKQYCAYEIEYEYEL